MKIIGHELQRRELTRLVIEDKLPSTMLFSGIPGIGKKLIARALAKALLCEKPKDSDTVTIEDLSCGSCHACSVFEAGNAPDFTLLECRDRDNWSTAQVREFLYSLHLTSFSGGRRVVVLNDAEAMAVQAASALLKLLEEPRPNLYFVLITPQRSKLLPTLLSRCHQWYFQRLSDAEVAEAISGFELAKDLEGAQARTSTYDLAVLADGSLENVAAVQGDLERWEQVVSDLRSTAQGDSNIGLKLVGQLAREKDELPNALRLMRICAHREMAAETEPETKLKWAHCLQNLLTAERLIGDRHLSAANVLNQIVVDLARGIQRPLFADDLVALDQIVVP